MKTTASQAHPRRERSQVVSKVGFSSALGPALEGASASGRAGPRAGHGKNQCFGGSFME